MVARERVGSNPETVLVVDDDRHIVQLVTLYLSKAGFRVLSANDSTEALRMVRQASPDLLVLDIMLPGPDGFEVCRALRRTSEVPIVILSARGSDLDKVAGLQFGADDYITKPFNPAELVARVQSVLRRSRAATEPSGEQISVGELKMDVRNRRALVKDTPLALTPKEFDLLATFARFANITLDREKLLDLVW